MKTITGFKDSLKSTLLGVCALAAVGMGSAQGAPLNLTLLDTPDILSSFITVNYIAGAQSLTAQGFAIQLDAPPVQSITDGTFDLVASIDNGGNLLGGTLDIGGTIAGLSTTSTLLTGTLTDFGFPDAGGDPLEFLFNVTGGDAATLYGGIGAVGGVILSGFSLPASLFTEDWTSGAFQAVADVAPVPLPAAFWMFGSALIGLAGFVRRKRH